ncbi:conserved hypothetical protein (DUF328) [Alteracholeplasma palmae J233]|uniref:Uncharacterized protein n=1 Tax=Alteracholeplasma palmae (strain ATCC 49389 / J233) TaxID=1318466 RepID=U4KL22_ALTPJ|nr:YaaA family protein [Alteracholeplasma palmae]CCV64437.1 conserved hypothetical protein (DUF328) [Alteracholeplasma palmae J233]
MIVFISPSKTFTKDPISTSGTSILFKKENDFLRNHLESLSKSDIIEIMKVSDKIATEVYSFYHSLEETYQAQLLYSGQAFKYLDAKNLTYQSNKLYILDAYYGILRPTDKISRYRLDFIMNLEIDLYNYWSRLISDYIHNKHSNEILIDLASSEFGRLIPRNTHYIKVDFRIGDKKESNMNLKKLRGLMANYIIQNNISSLEQLKSVSLLNYTFDAELSNDSYYIYKK